MLQELRVSSDAPIPIRPLIDSAIKSEVRMLDLALEPTRRRLLDFEKRYGWPAKSSKVDSKVVICRNLSILSNGPVSSRPLRF